MAQLHWIISDKNSSITVESVKDGIFVYDNPVGVLTNNPPFPFQMFNLNNYMRLSIDTPKNYFSEQIRLNAYSRGMGAIGLPGDLSSMSRFVRVAFTKMNSLSENDEKSSVSQFFHILGSVEQQRGCCRLADGKYEISIYTSCCNADRGIYYYKTYDNYSIVGVDMNREDLNGEALISYKLMTDKALEIQN
jgi:choloylglycine hydrolase